MAEQTDTRGYRAEMYRLQGELCLEDTAQAETWLLRAIAEAQALSTKLWELRATMSLSRLRQAAGAPAEFEAARQQLAELRAWFSEGLDTLDLQEAATLIY